MVRGFIASSRVQPEIGGADGEVRKLGDQGVRYHGLAFAVPVWLVPAVLAAQVSLKGTVRDSSGRGLPNVAILVQPGDRHAGTDASGAYALRLPPGTFTVLFRRIGYLAASTTVDLAAVDMLELDVVLEAAPAHLPEITVIESAPAPWLREAEERRRLGIGHFLDEALLRRSESRLFADLLRSIPGVRITRYGNRLIALGRSGTWCPMAIWVNGIRVYAPSSEETNPFRRTLAPGENAFLDNWHVTDLQLVEVYNVADTPSRFQATGSSCGTILLWTRTH